MNLNQSLKCVFLKSTLINSVAKITSSVCVSRLLAIALLVAGLGTAQAQTVDVEQIRWKSEAQVRALLGEPKSVHGPTGTHASYTLWKYQDYTVAFANARAFHLFNKDSLKKFELQENR